MTGPSITYTNVEQLGTDVTRFTLMPWLVRLEHAFTRLLPRPQYAKFNLDAFLRSDLRTRFESYKVGIEAGFLEVNEARAWENLDPKSEPEASEKMPSATMEPSMNAAPGPVEVRVVMDDGNAVAGVVDVGP